MKSTLFFSLTLISVSVIAQNPLTGPLVGNSLNGPILRCNGTANMIASNINQGPSPNNNVGIGVTLPAAPLHLVFNNTSSTGLRIDQQSSVASALILNQTNTSGKNWQLWSTGQSNTEGPGNFLIRDNTLALNRFFISGANGNVGIGTISPSALLHVNGDAQVENDTRLKQKLFVGSSQPANAAINGFNSTGQGGLYVKTTNNIYNTALEIDNNGRAFSVLNSQYSSAGPFNWVEFFTIYGDGGTHMGKNVQLGFSNPAIQDANVSLNINTLGQNGIRMHTWNNAAKLISVNNSNFTGEPFTLYGEGYAHLANCMQLGFTTHVMQRTDILMNINALNKMGLCSTTNHSGGGGYNTQIVVNQNLTKALVVVGPGGGPTGAGENFLVNGDGSTAVGGNYVPAGYKLAVAGKIIAEELMIQLKSSWPDYVFNTDHKLLPLSELKSYIDSNKHLPNIPSAAEVEKNGVTVGEMQVKQMEKIEELTLYIIELKEQMKEQQKEIEALKSKIK